MAGTPPPASFTRTSNTSSSRPGPACTPSPAAPLPFPVPPGDCAPCSKGSQRPAGRGAGRGRGSRGRGEPGGSGRPPSRASYRLWSTPPPAAPRCSPPSSRSSLGRRVQERESGSAGCGRLSAGLAPERTRRAARGPTLRRERERRRRRAGRTERAAGAGTGRRGAPRAPSCVPCGAAGTRGGGGWARAGRGCPAAGAPASRPLPAPPRRRPATCCRVPVPGEGLARGLGDGALRP